MAEVTWKLFRTMTGEPIGVPVTAPGNWRHSMSAIGSGTHRIPIPLLSRFTPAQWKAATSHWFCTLAEYYNGVPTYYGVIQYKAWDYRGTLTVKTVTVDDFFANRYTWGVGSGPGYNVAAFQIVQKSMRAALMNALRRVSGGVWGAEWDLPFRFHIDPNEAGAFSKKWESWDWSTGKNMIDLIRGMENGPDLAFVPGEDPVTGWAVWDVLIGNPRVDGVTVTAPINVRNGRLSKALLQEDGVRMLTGSFVRGDGSGKTRPFGEAGFMGGPPMPARDAARSIADIEDPAILASFARADLQRHRYPTRQHDIATTVGTGPKAFPIEATRLGSRIKLVHGGDGYEPPYVDTTYTIANSHDSRSPHTFYPEVQTL